MKDRTRIFNQHLIIVLEACIRDYRNKLFHEVTGENTKGTTPKSQDQRILEGQIKRRPRTNNS